MRLAQITEAAVRLAGMEPDEKEAALGKCSPELRDALSKELDAIQWLVLHYLLWVSQESWSTVLAYAASVADSGSYSAAA